MEYTGFMRGTIQGLRDLGYDADMAFHISNASYRGSRSGLARLWLRLRMYVFYPLQLLWTALVDRRQSIWVVCTNTFYAPLLAAWCSRSQRRQVVHLLYDLYPDVLVLAGSIRENRLPAAAIASVTGRTFRSCTANILLGERLQQYALAHYGENASPCEVIPVGANAEGLESEPTELGPDQAVRLLYCGNMGAMHDTATLAAGLRIWLAEGREELEFAFHSVGAGYADFQHEFRGRYPKRLKLGPGLDQGDWLQAMRQAQVGIVTMRMGAEKVLMPSKTYSAMMAGQAILAICPRQSDLADLVRQHDCGWVVEPGDRDGLLGIFDAIATMDSPTLQAKRLQAWNAAHELYDVKVLAKRWDDLFQRLAFKEPNGQPK